MDSNFSFDFRMQDFADGPYEVYKFLRDEHPVCKIVDGTYLLSRYSDVQLALKRYDIFAAGWVESSMGRPGWMREECRRGFFLAEIDPPDHGVHNAIINRAFTARSVNSLNPFMRDTAQLLVRKLKAKKSENVDFLADFAYPFVGSVIGNITGLDLGSDVERARRWIDVWDSIPINCPDPARKLEIESAIIEQNDVFDAVAKNRRACPRDDLASMIANATISGEKLSDQQLHAAFSLFAIGGVAAPSQLLAQAILVLSERKDLHAVLRNDSTKIPDFIEELLRFSASFQGSMRVTSSPVTLHGITIPAHSMVLALIGSANRDPLQFEDPDVFRLSRENVRSHLGFGYGPHVCIGSAMARLEVKIALETLIAEFDDFQCPPESGLDWYGWTVARLLRSLPVQFH